MMFFNKAVSRNAIGFFLFLLLTLLFLFFHYCLKGVFKSILKFLGKYMCGCIHKKKQKIKNAHVHYCYRVPNATATDDFCLDKSESILFNSEAEYNESLGAQLRRMRVKFYKEKRQKEQKYIEIKKLPKFRTVSSYNYRLHPDLKDQFIY